MNIDPSTIKVKVKPAPPIVPPKPHTSEETPGVPEKDQGK